MTYLDQITESAGSGRVLQYRTRPTGSLRSDACRLAAGFLLQGWPRSAAMTLGWQAAKEARAGGAGSIRVFIKRPAQTVGGSAKDESK